MSEAARLAPGAVRLGRAARLAHPSVAFALLSLLFGLVTIVVTPPFRGPDEPAHFLRAYGFAQGEVLASAVDESGRKGLLLPARLHDDFTFFVEKRYLVGTPGFTYHDAVEEYRQGRRARPDGADQRAPLFVLFEGSEGYSPGAYWPHIAAAGVAGLFDLDFLPTFYLMRLAGLLAMTAVAAAAIAIVPHSRWALALIGLLPAALYGRAMLSGDGAVVSYTMMVLALCVAVAHGAAYGPWQRSVWMLLCLLAKPPQLAFILLEAMTAPLRQLPRGWRSFAIVVLPGILLSFGWAALVGGDMGAWRMVEGGDGAPEHFQVGWKLRFMLEHPLHFPGLLLGSARDIYYFWEQLIGVMGWLDTPLRAWAYPALSALLVAACVERAPGHPRTRLRVAVICALAIVGYMLALFVVFYLAWTPIHAKSVTGIQGRYFVVVLPPLAVAIASLSRWTLPQASLAAASVAGAVLSGCATVEAILRREW